MRDQRTLAESWYSRFQRLRRRRVHGSMCSCALHAGACGSGLFYHTSLPHLGATVGGDRIWLDNIRVVSSRNACTCKQTSSRERSFGRVFDPLTLGCSQRDFSPGSHKALTSLRLQWATVFAVRGPLPTRLNQLGHYPRKERHEEMESGKEKLAAR
jgi:hypothetical protein